MTIPASPRRHLCACLARSIGPLPPAPLAGLADGVQVDVTKTAQEAGIKFPLFLTRTVYDAYVTVPPDVTGQDEAGRLWDVVWMTRFAILRARPDVETPSRPDDDRRRPRHLTPPPRPAAPYRAQLFCCVTPFDDRFAPPPISGATRTRLRQRAWPSGHHTLSSLRD